CAIHPDEYSRISMCNSAKEIWDNLKLIYKGTSEVKETKANILVHEYEMFKMSPIMWCGKAVEATGSSSCEGALVPAQMGLAMVKLELMRRGRCGRARVRPNGDLKQLTWSAPGFGHVKQRRRAAVVVLGEMAMRLGCEGLAHAKAVWKMAVSRLAVGCAARMSRQSRELGGGHLRWLLCDGS
ncbi:hypothetical protein Taro_025924, partial [Colocasia esculenta]|nr:hypothetical protein [Colocasia esculenta]